MPLRSLLLTSLILGAPLVPATALAATAIQEPAQDRNELFESIASRVVEGYLRVNPENATLLGDHRFDGQLSDLGEASRKEQARLARRARMFVEAIPASSLSQANQVDQAILLDKLNEFLFQLEEARDWQRNPMVYNPGSALDCLLSRSFAPLPHRLASVKARLLQVPGVLATARLNLVNPPRVYTETAIRQFQGTLGLIQNDVTAAAIQVGMKEDLAPAQAEAAKAMGAFIAWMQTDLLPRSHGDFRVGKAKFAKQLRYTLNSSLSMETILERAQSGLKATQAEMAQVAAPLYAAWFPASKETEPKVIIKAVLDKLTERRPDNATIVALATEDLAAATDYVRAQGLVTVPTEPLKIIVMPEYQRGNAVAYCESPGPLETRGETFFAISPTPSDWNPARVESFFREYNNAMVQDLTIHEAMPGHYLQGAHANRYKAASPVREIFGSGTFVEGWAVYMEQAMAKAGYGGPEVHMQQLKMRLRVIINAILDQKIQAGTMTEQEALDLMVKEGFQEEGEAVGKWLRACLSSTQLSTYFVGASEMDDLRAAGEAKAKALNKPFDAKAFHDQLLSFGSPAPKYVRLLMGL